MSTNADSAKNTTSATALLEVDNVRLQKKVKELERKLRNADDTQLSCELVKKEIFGFSSATPEVPKWILGATPAEKCIGVPVLVLSDLHWAEKIDPAQIGGRNKFDINIAKTRLRATAQKTIMLLKNYIAKNAYPGIVIPCLGDMMSGDIHEELVETNYGTSLQALLSLEGEMIAFIKTLADAFGKVYMPCVPGNHTRLTKKPHAKNAVYKTLDWLLYQHLRLYFQNDSRIVIRPSDSLDDTFEVFGTKFLITHGDQFKGGGGIQGGISPWMIGDYRKRKREASIGRTYDYMIMGHWHQLTMLPNIITNGSIKGFDEYAYRSNYPAEEPQQALFIVGRKKGICFWLPVKLGEDKTDTNSPWVSAPNTPVWSA